MTGSFSEKNISTIGLDKRNFTIDKKLMTKIKKLSKALIFLLYLLMDMKEKSFTKTYFKGADFILLIYDVTNRKSYNNVSMWIKKIYESLGNHETSKYIIVLLGNRIDLIGVDGKTRAVEENEAKLKCQEYKILWGGECSDKTFSQSELKNLIKGYVIKIYEKVGPKNIITKEIKKRNRIFFKESNKENNKKRENQIIRNIDPKYYFKKLYKYLSY